MTTPKAHAYCYAHLAAGTRPRDRLTVSDWADRYRVLSSKQSGERGRWRTSRNPILREIMDCLSATSQVREIVVMKSSQVGVTEAMINKIGYNMDHAPCPTMVLMPTLESRDSWKVQKLNPLLQETGVIRDLLGGLKSRDAANSKDVIDFPGGILFLAGGNSPNSYAQKSVRDLLMDDLDRFPGEVGEEGDPVALARGRCKSFPRYKLMLVSTPTIKGSSLIEREYLLTDQRRYHVHCPACSTAQPLHWENLKWEQVNKPPREAWYECASCGHAIMEHHKPALLSGGQWIAEHPENKRRGYHVSALYAPIGLGPSWLDLAVQFLEAKGDPGTLKTFINTNLGETWEDQTSSLKTNDLEKRQEIEFDMGQIPPGVVALTAFIDTQDTWLDITMIGWHEGGVRLIDWHQIQGDTARQPPWDEAAAWINTVRRNAWGRPVPLRAVGVDSRGHRGEQVRAFVQRPDLKVKVYACQGATSRLGRPIATTASYPDKDRRGKPTRGGYALWNIGTEFCKDFIYGHLVSDGHLPVEARVFRFPAGVPTEYFDGLLAEVYNPETKRYEQKKGARYKRNEPLDGMVGAWAMGQHREVNIGHHRNGKPDPGYWARMRAVLEADSVPEPIKPEQVSHGTIAPPLRPALPKRIGGISRR
jgi:phage terminase large subunit GpA-like protein